MDSLTQIVLGAAVGEACLGKKLGNRAMIWGGIAGTIPDLDIIGNIWMSEIEALAFHRGISHSIFFAVLGSIGFGSLIFYLHQKFWTSGKTIRQFEWMLMFFLGFLTHTMLDCFTTYGTQIFAPFSDYRIAIGSISVADPMYTIPFIVCLLIAASKERISKKRRFWNYAGIIISSLYLLFTVVNKSLVVSKFKTDLEQAGIAYKQMMVTPTILNNVLWNCVAETEENYVGALYSFFDKKGSMHFKDIEKRHHLITNKEDETFKVLKWFTNGYYNVSSKPNDQLQVNDLRYGAYTISDDGEEKYVFRFNLEKNKDKSYHMTAADGGPKRGDESQMFKTLWERIKGI